MSGHQSGGVVLTEAEREAIRIAISADLVPVVPTPSAEWIGWWLTQDRPRKTPGVIERLITRRLAVQAGRVAEVVEKVHLAHELVDGGVIPLYQCAAEGCEWTCDRIEFSPTEAVQLHAAHLGAVVAAELEADHG